MAPRKRKISQERLDILQKARDKYKNLQKLRKRGCNVFYKKEEMQQKKRKLIIEQFVKGLESVNSENFSLFQRREKPINPTPLPSINSSVEDMPESQLIIMEPIKFPPLDLAAFLKESLMHSVPEEETSSQTYNSSDTDSSDQDIWVEEDVFGGEMVSLGEELFANPRELLRNQIMIRNTMRAAFPQIYHRFVDFVPLFPSLGEAYDETDSSTSTSSFERDEDVADPNPNPSPLEVNEAEGEQAHEAEGEQAHEAEGEQAHEVEGEEAHEAEGEQAHEAEGEQAHEVEGEQAHEVEGEEAGNVSARHQRWLRRSRSSHSENDN